MFDLEVLYYDDFVLLRQEKKETELTADDKVKGKSFRRVVKEKTNLTL